jgi:AmmeMemoRadiSam system protein B
MKKLGSHASIFTVSDVPHLEEHCLEVQLPFLAALFPEAQIAPILIGKAGIKTVETLAEALRLTFEPGAGYTVYVISANMASYMKGTDTPRESENIMSLIEKADWRPIASASGKAGVSSCGAACIATGLLLAGGRVKAQRLAQADSLGVDGDAKRTVHYAAFGISRN